jgi:tetratricopeptide (TPR) repeat protein
MKKNITILLLSIISVMFAVSSCKDHKAESNRKVKEGIQKIYQSEYTEALVLFDEAIKHDKNNAEAYYFRGNAFMNLKDYNTAIENYTQAIVIKQDYAEAYYNRGLVKSYMGERNFACEDFLKAESLGKQNIEDLTKWCK